MTPRVVVLTGAGVSADSGLATFRGPGGLWEGHRVEDVATPLAWQADPRLVWRFYQLRRATLDDVEPNEAHRALVTLEERVERAGGDFLLVTQNVDDLHERAGSRRLLHVHGELSVLRCEACGERVRDRASLDPERYVPCAGCGHERLRPDVVWFGEVPRHLDEVETAAARCTHFLSVGTSGVVWPVAGLLQTARVAGARTWVNALEPPETLLPGDTFVLGPAARVLPDLVAALTAGWGR